MKRLSKADQWLVEEIMTNLVKNYDITAEKAEKIMKNSSFYPLLLDSPEFVHHEDPMSWVDTIAEQNDLPTLSQLTYH
ncbi:hypothetical protein [Gracilibacillus timonensis]|uniref:hypothetical protein n=1 Tax=Gracilibacillus timonensis TaxID=1816696 RepID=UPI000826E13A|nr:hypothetical protein [Gracilibacillus timonensis]